MLNYVIPQITQYNNFPFLEVLSPQLLCDSFRIRQCADTVKRDLICFNRSIDGIKFAKENKQGIYFQYTN